MKNIYFPSFSIKRVSIPNLNQYMPKNVSEDAYDGDILPRAREIFDKQPPYKGQSDISNSGSCKSKFL